MSIDQTIDNFIGQYADSEGIFTSNFTNSNGVQTFDGRLSEVDDCTLRLAVALGVPVDLLPQVLLERLSPMLQYGRGLQPPMGSFHVEASNSGKLNTLDSFNETMTRQESYGCDPRTQTADANFLDNIDGFLSPPTSDLDSDALPTRLSTPLNHNFNNFDAFLSPHSTGRGREYLALELANPLACDSALDLRIEESSSNKLLGLAGFLLSAGGQDHHAMSHIAETDHFHTSHPPSGSLAIVPHAPRNLKRKRPSSSLATPIPIRTHPLTLKQKKEASETRKAKACVRCHKQNIKCEANENDPDGPCATCLKIKRAVLVKLPCYRYRVSDSQLLDKGPHPRFVWTKRWKKMDIVEISEWISSEIKTITITQDIFGATYDLRVREFKPIEGVDTLQRTWNSNGKTRSHPCAPYAIVDMKGTGKQFVQFVDDKMVDYIEYYTGGSNGLVRDTYRMAYQWYKTTKDDEERSLLLSVLRLWVASRMESRQDRICSDEVLGMRPQTSDPYAKNYNWFLVPPVLQAQIELITTVAVLIPMKDRVLKGLHKLFKANKPKHWFTIYLCVFILLHSCALLTCAENVRATREALLGPQSRFYDFKLVEEFHNGAKIMLYYFHHGNKGSFPFEMDWESPETVTFANLNPEQVKFVKKTKQEVAQKRELFERIHREGIFENEYFFVSQLYDMAWAPMKTV